MARNTFSRTITSTTIYGSSIVPDENGELKETKLDPITVNGDLTPERQQYVLFKTYGDKYKNVIVTKATSTSHKYAISVENFIKYGEIVDDDAQA
jgi:hypothetical protein